MSYLPTSAFTRSLCVVLSLTAAVAIASSGPDLEMSVEPIEAGLADVIRCQLTVTAPLTASIQLPAGLPPFTNLELIERIDSPITVVDGRQHRQLLLLLRLVDTKAAAIPELPTTFINGPHRDVLHSPPTTIAFKSYLPEANVDLQPIYDDAPPTHYALWLIVGVAAVGTGAFLMRRRQRHRATAQQPPSPTAVAAAIRQLELDDSPVRYYERVNRHLLQHLFPEAAPTATVTTGELIRRLRGDRDDARQQLGNQLRELADARYAARDPKRPCQAYADTVAAWLTDRESAA